MNRNATFNKLVRSLYMSAAGLEDINQSLRHVCRLFNSHVVGCITTNTLDATGQISFGIGVPQYQRENYRNNFARKNVLIDASMPDLMAGKAVRSSSYFTDTEFAKTSYYNEFMKDLGAFHNAGFIFGSKDDLIHTLTIGRGRKMQRFCEDEMLYMTALIPHVEAALHINSHINLLKSESRSKSSALDQLTIGVCFLTKDMRIVEANLVARQALNEGGLLGSANGHLTSGRRSHSGVRKMICSMSRGIENNYQVKVTNDVTQANCFLSVFPILDSGDFGWIDSKETRYVMFIGNELTPGEHCKSFLVNEFGLTERELELVSLLLNGSSLTKAALCLQISHETARSHLKSIFMKMEIHSQSQLAVTVSRLNSVN